MKRLAKKQRIFQEIILFANEHFNPKECFLCVYGSYASGHFTSESDADMFVGVKEYDLSTFKSFRDFIHELHVFHNLKLDDEVPYENKIMITYEDIQNAVLLKAFIKEEEQYFVPTIIKSKEFLASKEIRWRLALNALTTPHECIFGNRQSYLDFKGAAEKSIMYLAHGLSQKHEPTSNDIFKALVAGPEGEEGELYLGYKIDRPKVLSYLNELIVRNSTP